MHMKANANFDGICIGDEPSVLLIFQSRKSSILHFHSRFSLSWLLRVVKICIALAVIWVVLKLSTRLSYDREPYMYPY